MNWKSYDEPTYIMRTSTWVKCAYFSREFDHAVFRVEKSNRQGGDRSCQRFDIASAPHVRRRLLRIAEKVRVSPGRRGLRGLRGGAARVYTFGAARRGRRPCVRIRAVLPATRRRSFWCLRRITTGRRV